MRVVSIGDLVTDYYYKNEKLLGINGGMTSHNIIANLAKMGIKTTVFGTCGKDMQGEIAIKSLEKLGVDVKNIIILDDESKFIKNINLEKLCNNYFKNKILYGFMYHTLTMMVNYHLLQKKDALFVIIKSGMKIV